MDAANVDNSQIARQITQTIQRTRRRNGQLRRAAVTIALAVIAKVRWQTEQQRGSGNAQRAARCGDCCLGIARISAKWQIFKNTTGNARLCFKADLVRGQTWAHRKPCHNIETGLARCAHGRGIIAALAGLDHPHGCGNRDPVPHVTAEVQLCNSAWRLATYHRYDGDLCRFQPKTTDIAFGQDNLGSIVSNCHPAVDACHDRNTATQRHLDVTHCNAAIDLPNLETIFITLADKIQPHIFNTPGTYLAPDPVSRPGHRPVRPDVMKITGIHIVRRQGQ